MNAEIHVYRTRHGLWAARIETYRATYRTMGYKSLSELLAGCDGPILGDEIVRPNLRKSN